MHLLPGVVLVSGTWQQTRFTHPLCDYAQTQATTKTAKRRCHTSIHPNFPPCRPLANEVMINVVQSIVYVQSGTNLRTMAKASRKKRQAKKERLPPQLQPQTALSTKQTTRTTFAAASAATTTSQPNRLGSSARAATRGNTMIA